MAGNEPRAQQNYSIPIVAGVTVGLNTITDTAISILTASNNRKRISFHNPNTTSNANLLVFQTLNASGSAQNCTFASPGGGWVIFPGGTLEIDGDASGGAWSCVASVAGPSGVTITPSSR